MDSGDSLPVAVRGLSYAFRDSLSEHQVLAGIDLDVRGGEVVILTGPSGSGKTTLVTLIGALRAAGEGSVKVLGRELVGASRRQLTALRRQVGYIFQQHNLLDYLTVGQNILMSRQLAPGRLTRAQAREDVARVLERVGLEAHINKRPGALSGGQKQRVGIARALVNQPRLILADEPTASLDGESGRNVVNLIQELARREGATVILVTHDNRILDVADRILHLEDGVIRPVSEAVASSACRMLRLLERHDPEASHALAALALGLVRVAMADNRIDDAESASIRRALAATSQLSGAEVELVMELALSQLRLRLHARPDGKAPFTAEQSRHLIASLRAVAGADGAIQAEEIREIEAVAAELGISVDPAAQVG